MSISPSKKRWKFPLQRFLGFFSLMTAITSVLGYAQSSSSPSLAQAPSVPRGTIQSFASGINNQAIAIDASGNLWIASAPPIYRVDNTKEIYESRVGRVTTGINRTYRAWVSGPGPQTVTELSREGTIIKVISQIEPQEWLPGQWWGPFSIAVDSQGGVWVPVVMYQPILSRWSIGSAGLECDGLYNCFSVAEVRGIKINSSGLVEGNYSVGRAYSDEKWIPSVAADSSGNVFFATSSDRLRAGIITKFSTSGMTQGLAKISNRVYKIALDKAGNVWGTNTISDNISGLAPSGGILGPINTHHASTGIAIDQTGNFWVGGNAHEIEKISPDGTILSTTPIANNTGDGPRVLRVDTSGNIWAVNQMEKPNQGSSVVELDQQGKILATYPMPYPTDLAIDRQGNVWVTNALFYGNNLYEITGVATGPQYSP